MGVVFTNKLLREFIKRKRETESIRYLELQRKLLCDPVAEHLKEYPSEQLHKYLLENGLFHPDAKILKEIRELEKQKVWTVVTSHYESLKKAWNGEEATIFIFPVERRNEMIMKELHGKMGISFHKVIILFLSKELSKKEICALLTHEYNHVCRLAYLDKHFKELTLLDSLLIEGMAEVAVEEFIGKDFSAPWISLYSRKELQPYWVRVKDLLHLKGKHKHDMILYGDMANKNQGFPRWFGYVVGYLIIKDYIKTHRPVKMSELLKKDSNEIFKESKFNL
jgi:uncharacterized protein YjaZ